jgi:hypothetical protein
LGLLCYLPVGIGLFADGISGKAQKRGLMLGTSEVLKV